MFKKITKVLKLQYLFFWLIPILSVLTFEMDILPVGLYADDPQMQYVWETIGILTAIVCIPFSLKLFNIVLKKKIDKVELSSALHKYVWWSGIRLGILEVAVLLNIIVYYFTLSNVGGFCGLIALVASLFCYPSENRLMEELKIADQKD